MLCLLKHPGCFATSAQWNNGCDRRYISSNRANYICYSSVSLVAFFQLFSCQLCTLGKTRNARLSQPSISGGNIAWLVILTRSLSVMLVKVHAAKPKLYGGIEELLG